MPDRARPFPFLRLPLELRLRIYALHLTRPIPIPIWEDSKPSIATRLLQTNRQTTSEATPVFYGTNAFQLWCARVCTCAGIHSTNAPYCFKKRPDTAVTRFIEHMKTHSFGHMIKHVEIILFSPLPFEYMQPSFTAMMVRLPPQFTETFTALQSIKVAFAVTECPWGLPTCRYSADFCSADFSTDHDLCKMFEMFKEGFKIPQERVTLLDSIEGRNLEGKMCWGKVRQDRNGRARVQNILLNFIIGLGILVLVLECLWGLAEVLLILIDWGCPH